MDDLEEAIRDIETRTGVRPGFFDDLAKEDDWSFVIKSHALVESTCSELLAERSGEPKTIDVFSRIELSARSTGKVAFLKAFGLLIDRERRFISALSELRNQLVHSARYTTFNLNDYVSGLDTQQKTKFIESFGYAYLAEDKNGKELIPLPDRVLKQPKQTIWLSLRYVLGVMSVQMVTIRMRKEIRESAAAIAAIALPSS